MVGFTNENHFSRLSNPLFYHSIFSNLCSLYSILSQKSSPFSENSEKPPFVLLITRISKKDYADSKTGFPRIKVRGRLAQAPNDKQNETEVPRSLLSFSQSPPPQLSLYFRRAASPYRYENPEPDKRFLPQRPHSPPVRLPRPR